MMHNPLTWFLVFCVAVWGTVLYFWRGALKELSRQASAHARAYAIAYARGSALVLIASISSFIEVFEKLSPDTAVVLSWWMWLTLFFKPVLAALTTLVAFMDSSVARVKLAAENAEADLKHTP